TRGTGMLRTFDCRPGHYLLIAAVWALACLPNLGGPTLWDMDEGLNATAAREMLDSGNLVVPTFNYQLRTAKPALLYWLQAGGYRLLGVNETAARLPSALAALLALLATYELGRSALGRGAALLGAVVLGTSVGVVGAAHFANPDALLLAFTTLALALWFRFWQTDKGAWLYAAAVACGLAVLAKGPVGVVLPAAVTFVFLLWQRQLGRLLDLRGVEAALVFVLVAAPWYVWVGLETKGQFLREVAGREHLGRFLEVMERHAGSPLYYLVAVVVGLFPSAGFFRPAAARALGDPRGGPEGGERAGVRFLVVWFAVYFVFFSVAATKLPNYVLPLYPAAALLTARTLERWRAGEHALAGWVMPVSLACLALSGAGVAAGLLLAGGAVPGLPAGGGFPRPAAGASGGRGPASGA